MTESSNRFAELGLSEPLVAALTTLGYEAPTPIQERTIPVLVAGRDLIGQAQTGTGKTAAFALPVLQQLDPKSKQTQALVLAPTRELAMQVADAIHSYAAKSEGVTVMPIYGGAPIFPQLKRLERGVQIVVGTPGRLIDHLDRGSLKLDGLKMIVLDEADEMLKMGFIEDIERILSSAPKPRQTALFSATMPDEVLRIAKRYLDNPERIEIEHKTMTAPDIEQRFLNLSEGQKLDVLTLILELEPSEAVLIFRRTKNGAAELAEKLEGRGFTAVAMHGDMTQSLRESVIRRLRAGQVEIVVATDVAARGLDVEQIEHVINYDIPYDVEAYVHRIGRTGRAGRKGLATLFITPRERRMMREIERYTGMAIKPMRIPTSGDIAAHRIAQFKDNIRKTIADGDLDVYVSLVEQLVDEGQNDLAEIAAAAAKLASQQRKLDVAPEPMVERRAPAAAETSDTPGGEVPRRPTPDRDNEQFARLQMSVGRRDGIRPADIVGSIANEADIPGREIGPIDIQEDITYVTIPERHVEHVLQAVGRAKFRGRPVNLKRAEKVLPGSRREERPRERPSFRPREDGPRPSYRAREEAPRERPAYRPREEGTRERPPFRAREDRRPPSRDDRPPFHARFGKRDDRDSRGGGAGRPARPGTRPTKPRGKR
ncbi:MAG TPA: DEAD/DEAH box helicase [Thermoanaerobaculia bacterium]|nr:DEAD/DEAH box helicase [Thermoanaerobaculia bacterium]